jgi:DNA-directed RNA polymerase subunit RPC12/RpoP
MTFYREKPVTTKKPHRCFGCWRKFPSGTKMIYTAGKDSEGNFGTNYVCHTCHKIMDAMKYDEVSELSPGDLLDYALELERTANATTIPVAPAAPVLPGAPPSGNPDGSPRA